MTQRLEGQLVHLRTAADARKLIGKRVEYLRDCDIDKSGRGYFFPRYDTVAEVHGRQIIFGNGNSTGIRDIVELVIMEDKA
jgi:hypothetical protein